MPRACVALLLLSLLFCASHAASIFQVWSYTVPSSLVQEAPPTVTPSAILFPARNTTTNVGEVVALDSFTGKLKWVLTVDTDYCSIVTLNWLILYPLQGQELVVVDCTTTCAGSACGYFALNTSSGAVLWKHPTQSTNEVQNGVLDSERGVFYGIHHRTMAQVALTALNATTGGLIWTVDLDAQPEVMCLSQLPAGDGGLKPTDASFLVTQHPNQPVKAFLAESGKPAWSYAIGNNALSCGASTVFVNDPNTNLVALDASTGAVLWRKSASVSFELDAGNGVCVLQNGSSVLFATCASGDITNAYTMTASVNSLQRSPSDGLVFSIDQSGAVLITSDSGKLVARLPWTCQTPFGSCQFSGRGAYIFSYNSASFVMGGYSDDSSFVVSQYAINGTRIMQLPSATFDYYPPHVKEVLPNFAVFFGGQAMYAVSLN